MPPFRKAVRCLVCGEIIEDGNCEYHCEECGDRMCETCKGKGCSGACLRCFCEDCDDVKKCDLNGCGGYVCRECELSCRDCEAALKAAGGDDYDPAFDDERPVFCEDECVEKHMTRCPARSPSSAAAYELEKARSELAAADVRVAHVAEDLRRQQEVRNALREKVKRCE